MVVPSPAPGGARASRADGIYDRIGVRTIINGRGATTAVGGTLMSAEVLAAMAEASKSFVVLDELNQAVGRKIAELTGAEDGYVTSGSAAGMALAAAACITGSDPDRVYALPMVTDGRNEIIVHRAHRLNYDQMYRAAGGSIVEIGELDRTLPEELERAIGPRTAALAYHDSPNCTDGALDFATCVDMAHRHGIPVIVDAASTLPPVDHLRRWIRWGADLVIYSGGKGIRGPQDAGLLAGRADLIAAARMNGSPNAAVGRGMKVSKEAMAGLWVALDLFMSADHEQELRFHTAQAERMRSMLSSRADLRCAIEADWEQWPAPVVRIFPVACAWQPEAVRIALIDSEPSIHLNVEHGGLMINTHCLREEEDVIIARRLAEFLDQDAAPSAGLSTLRS